MKFRYAVTYAIMADGLDSPEAVKKAFGDHIKVAEENGLKVPFWGSPWGTNEGVIIVYEFDDISKYEKFMEVDRKQPFTGDRTNIVMEW